MSIIAVHGFPLKVTLGDVSRLLGKTIQGHFEVLNFDRPNKKAKAKSKTCYLRLSEKLDPVRIVERINDYNGYAPNTRKFVASIPDQIPDIPLGGKIASTEEERINKILQITTDDILQELQAKYPGLYRLSQTTGHKLLQELAKKILSRLTELVKGSSDLDTCFKLSKAYRRCHPHFGDFQLVLSTLHSIEDATGSPRTQLQEAEFSSSTAPDIIDMPVQKVQQLCNKYSEKIVKKMTEHINSLDSEISPNDNEEEIARKQVRDELKKLSPYLSMLVSQVVGKELVPKEGYQYRIRVYGEPFLPSKDVMAPFLARFHPQRVIRSTRMYNMMGFSVAPNNYPGLIAMNGTVLNGAKLLIRELNRSKPVYTTRRAKAPDDSADEEDQQESDHEM